MAYADYIQQIEIDSLWSGTKHILWPLHRHVNVLSGINGVGKSTILTKIIRSLSQNSAHASHTPKGIKLTLMPQTADEIRFDVVRSFDRPLINADVMGKLDLSLTTELDWQLFQLQRKYLDYQVNVGNQMIAALQSGTPDGAAEAQRYAAPKQLFQDLIDCLFAETGKTIVRTENEIRFNQMGERLLPYQLSSGEKQMLMILLTVLMENQLPYVLLMDEPEVSLHFEWQKQLIDLILQLNPNVQLIITTHSPAVIMNGWMDHVTEVTDITLPD